MYNNTLQTTAANNTTIGLLYHGYDYSHAQPWASEDRGHSPEIWDRALGLPIERPKSIDLQGLLKLAESA